MEFYEAGDAPFQHQHRLGTERMRTAYNGAVEATFTSLPFGDAQTTDNADAYHYAGLDHDTETNSDHAQFRQYSSTQGRWLSPDPYGGSYDLSNPQSMSRYAYVEDNPTASVDSLGLARYLGNGCWEDSFGIQNSDGSISLYVSDWCNGGEDSAGDYFYGGAGYWSPPLFGGPSVRAPNTGTIAPLSRAACASMVADSEYSIAANTSGSSPDNPIVQALLGNSVSGLYNMWNAPSISSGLQQLVVGGYNPGIPGGIAIDGGLAGVYTNGAIKAAATNLGEAAGETAASVIGATKFAYDLGAWAYAYVARCR